jgi:4-amino-4-deoxy-L-arabinose transferase-like glycosyltransferase
MDQRARARAGWLPLLALLACAVPLYAWRLGDVPRFGGDEARFAVHAWSLATTGRDLDGRVLPLQIWIEEYARWYQPALFYLMAGTLMVAPLADWSARLSTVFIGLLDIVLMYAVARRLWPRVWQALVATAFLALTPAHLIFSRQALDYICPLPFMLAWLWCLLGALESGRVKPAAAAGLLLGVGVYAHIAAWLMMPLLLIITWMALLASGRGVRPALACTAAFLLVVSPLLVWLWTHPAMLTGTIDTYRLYDAARLSPLQGAREFLNYTAVESRLSVYWDYFNPGFLFMSGGAGLTSATRRIGVFALPFVVFLPCGLYALWTRRSIPARILLAGLVLAPLPAAIVDSRYMIQRAMWLIPFGVLVAAAGVLWMWGHARRLVRFAAVLLLVGVLAHYAAFYVDYQTNYQRRSAVWFDPAAFGAVADYLTASTDTRAQKIYLSDSLDDGAAHWRYQLTKRARMDVWERSEFFAHDRFDPSAIEPGSLIIVYASDPLVGRLTSASGCCDVEAAIANEAGETSTVILRARR